jgi:uncharacterized protein
MRVTILGATGFIGRALVARLLRDGCSIVAWVRDPERARSQLGAEAELVAAVPGSLAASLSGADAVVNLAGESVLGGRWSAARRRLLGESRVALTRQLVAALGQASPRPRVLVSASAIGYYGDRGDQEVDETATSGSDFLAGLTRAWEEEARAAEPLGIRVALPRIGIVLGAEGGALERMLPLFRRGLGGRLGSGRQQVSWIHQQDLIASLAQALGDERLAGPFNATAPAPVSNAQLTAELGRVLGRRTPLAVPELVLRLTLGEAAGVLLGGQRVLPRKLQALGFSFTFPELRAALEDLLGGSGGQA